MSKIKVILADDHVIVRNGIKILLESNGDVDVIAEASNGEEALEKVRLLKPDILISDIRMPIMNGIEATARLKEFSPNTKALILSMHDDEEYIIKSIESGASGYLLKDTTKEEFSKALHAILDGQKYFSGDISNILVNSYLNIKDGKPVSTSSQSGVIDYHITKREKQILQLVYEGNSNKEIADKLGKSVRTVETHRFNIMKKLSVSNITELLRKIDAEPYITQ
ncbi:two component transcriptional regulator, LuxR family [Reichenbachiella agariperforans]|uniref:Two component transcriptional regulator, LuxR family n=1 Tax=Reichenbachiella agariperforans TaxID=156994 RepID=A0A1M6JU85_REIAG|nr:response regulator transcription factor [Reichenbachiella agariperforans]SHJ50226.1 two component transcriptional regulator, LuxR family [Reichenbachiella agariperforans]